MARLEDLTVETFRPLLNDTFRVVEQGQERELRLIEAGEVGAGVPAASRGRAPFSIVFEDNVEGSFMAQGIHALEHESLGRLEIFLVPIQPQSNRFQYQAIFT